LRYSVTPGGRFPSSRFFDIFPEFIIKNNKDRKKAKKSKLGNLLVHKNPKNLIPKSPIPRGQLSRFVGVRLSVAVFLAVPEFCVAYGLSFSAYPCYTNSIVSLMVSWFPPFFPGFPPSVFLALVPPFLLVVLWRRLLFLRVRLCLLGVRVALTVFSVGRSLARLCLRPLLSVLVVVRLRGGLLLLLARLVRRVVCGWRSRRLPVRLACFRLRRPRGVSPVLALVRGLRWRLPLALVFRVWCGWVAFLVLLVGVCLLFLVVLVG